MPQSQAPPIDDNDNHHNPPIEIDIDVDPAVEEDDPAVEDDVDQDDEDLDDEEQDDADDDPRRSTDAEDGPPRSSSPQSGSKRSHTTDDEGEDMDIEEPDLHVSKAPKLQKKTPRPKAADYDEFGKELVLAAANIYRALLASQGAFPDTSTELKLIKKSWSVVNTQSGVNHLLLTPSIVTIVSNSIRF